jgi:cytochrome c-type biogenesis protein CcmE
MKRSRLYLLGGVLLVAFGGFALSSFNDSMTPYVSFDEAQSTSRVVQVAGELAKGSSDYDETSGSLSFSLVDPKSRATMTVRYHGVKPANFEDALSVVAIGSYHPDHREFAADKLLVKCPSKYQGAEVKEYS